MKHTLQITLIFCLVFSSFAFALSGALALTPATTDIEAVAINIDAGQSVGDPIANQTVAILLFILNNSEEALTDPTGFNNITSTIEDFVIDDTTNLFPSPSSSNPVKPGDLYYHAVVGHFTSAGVKTLSFTIDGTNDLAEFDETNNTVTKTVTVADGLAISDSKSVSDIKQIQTALELYFNDHLSYPPAFGGDNLLGIDVTCLGSNGFDTNCFDKQTTYMGSVPKHTLSPQHDYKYYYCNSDRYIIEFYIEEGISTLQPGLNFATPDGIVANADVDSCLNEQDSVPNLPFEVKSGWLIKNIKYAEVFYVDQDLGLRWIVNEAVAAKNFGPMWNKNIQEFEDLGTGFAFGKPITEDNATVPKSVNLDSDRDGLPDAQEYTYGTDINKVDTDADGLTDRDEVKIFGTDPHNPDTDGDGFLDGDEVKSGHNPNSPGSLP